MSNNSESGQGPTSPPAPPAKGRPAPPAKGRPAPPAKGRPAPPRNGAPLPPEEMTACEDCGHLQSSENHRCTKCGYFFSRSISSQTVNHEMGIKEKAMEMELEGKFSEAAVLYRQLGMLDKENLCLSLALAKAKNSGVMVPTSRIWPKINNSVIHSAE